MKTLIAGPLPTQPNTRATFGRAAVIEEDYASPLKGAGDDIAHLWITERLPALYERVMNLMRLVFVSRHELGSRRLSVRRQR